ncbi:gefF [Symbiodinium sp. CCMP2592]|nr:gefF [Symbiodinium sp. CCMP2592]
MGKRVVLLLPADPKVRLLWLPILAQLVKAGRVPRKDDETAGAKANYWEQLSPSGTAPSARYRHTAVWSPAANGFYVFGGRSGGSRLNDLWFYGREASEGHRELLARHGCKLVKYWQILAPQGVLLGPPSMFRFDLHAAFHEEMLSIRHAFQVNSWEQVSPSGTAPSTRYSNTAVWSPAANGFYVFGGYDSGYLNDLWFYGREASEGVLLGPSSMFRFDLHAAFREEMLSIRHVSQVNSWEQVSPNGTKPSARYRHTAVWSPAANGFYVFGGSGGPGPESTSEAARLRAAWPCVECITEVNSWEQVSPSGTAPTGREAHTAVWSPAANGFYVFGGSSGPGPESRSEAARQRAAWEQVSPNGTKPSARQSHTAVWSPAANGFYVFGGHDDGCSRASFL